MMLDGLYMFLVMSTSIIFTYTCIYIYIYIYMYVCMYVCMYVYMHAYVYICVCMGVLFLYVSVSSCDYLEEYPPNE